MLLLILRNGAIPQGFTLDEHGLVIVNPDGRLVWASYSPWAGYHRSRLLDNSSNCSLLLSLSLGGHFRCGTIGGSSAGEGAACLTDQDFQPVPGVGRSNTLIVPFRENTKGRNGSLIPVEERKNEG